TKHPLEFVITERLLFADKKGDFLRESLPALHRLSDGFHQILQVNERLPVRDVAGKQVADHLALVDALYLVGERNGMAVIVIDTRNTQHHKWNVAMPGVEQVLRLDLGLRIVPLRLDGPLFVNPLARLAGRVDEDGAG